jgi:hypothetical protein
MSCGGVAPAADMLETAIGGGDFIYSCGNDVHQSLMHTLAHYMRQHAMPADLIVQRRF